MATPLAYFITFHCYGSHLHGAEPGSVDRNHRAYGSRYVPPDATRLSAAEAVMDQEPYLLDPSGRYTVLQSIQQVCAHRGWTLVAAHVRTTHVHVVVEAGQPPEAVMHDFKAYATRLLNHGERKTRRWSRHGS